MNGDKNNITEIFVELGRILQSESDSGALEPVIAESVKQNRWFTERYVKNAVSAICSRMLQKSALEEWLDGYDIKPHAPKRVGLIMAGNIPMVGFADMLAVLASGNRCIIKPSSKDSVLTSYVVGKLKEIDSHIPVETVTEIERPDVIIATGNDNTVRILKVKYGCVPAIFRGSRTSVAVLSGGETKAELQGLADDIFMYCGLGCRNVSHLFLPAGYDIEKLCGVLSQYGMENEKYLNNYRQNRALSELNGKKYLDGGFFTLTESPDSATFISEITYSHYSKMPEVGEWLRINDSKIQCVVAKSIAHAITHPRMTEFGTAQYPKLNDYADGIDVMKFLLTFD